MFRAKKDHGGWILGGGARVRGVLNEVQGTAFGLATLGSRRVGWGGTAMARASGERTAEELLEKRLRYRFRDAGLLRLALTHSSLAFEQGDGSPNRTSEDNEQLEFLGDAVLGLVVTGLLYERFAERREGDLTRMRAMLVSRKKMGEVGARLRLGEALYLGRGEEGSGGRAKPALLANTVEAVIAAMYLDAGPKGLATVQKLIEREIFAPAVPELEAAAAQGARFGGVIGDWKSALQELLQARGLGQPQYRTVGETGDDHNKRFAVEVVLGEAALAAGEGTSKKAAQQDAAHRAYLRMEEETPSAEPGEASAPGRPDPANTAPGASD